MQLQDLSYTLNNELLNIDLGYFLENYKDALVLAKSFSEYLGAGFEMLFK